MLRGDTVTITREPTSLLVPRYRTIVDGPLVRTMPELRPEPFIESDHPDIQDAALSISRGQRDPRVLATRITRWIYDSLRKEPTSGITSALSVLRTRRGDANEHAQLFVALARASGIPARIVSGYAYADGRFYYHAWPEIRLRRWVAVDPMFNQFPADAGHLRFASGLSRQQELLRLAGSLRIDVLETSR